MEGETWNVDLADLYIYRASRKFINNTPETAKIFKDLIQHARPGQLDEVLHPAL